MLAAYMVHTWAAGLPNRLVEGAKAPENGQILIRDSEVKGFALRITANGCKTWVWDGRIQASYAANPIARYPDLGLNEARSRALTITTTSHLVLTHLPGGRRDPIEITLGKIVRMTPRVAR